jgi:hypothetical protein
MAYLTLADLARDIKTDPLGYFLALSQDIQIANRLYFKTAVGGSAHFKRYDSLPAAQFRSLNSAPEASCARPRDVEIDVKYLGYEFDVDYKLADKQDGGRAAALADQRLIASKSISKTFNKYFFDGDADGGLEFDGIKKIAASNDAVVSVADNGGALTLEKLDEAINLARRCDDYDNDRMTIFCNEFCADKIKSLLLAKNAINLAWDSAGKDALYYNGVPVRVIRDDATGNPILDFNETQGNSSAASSLYVVTFARSEAETGLFGVQDGMPEETVEKTVIGEKRYVQWGIALAASHKYAVTRLKGILKS